MDIVSQLQDHTNHISFLLTNTVGLLQRDAVPSTIPGKPLPAVTPAPAPSQAGTGQPVTAAAAPGGAVGPGAAGNESSVAVPPVPVLEQVPEMASGLVQALKLFDMLVDALPPDIDLTEEEQLQRIEALNAENEAVASEMAVELDGVAEDLAEVRRLFRRVVDGSLQYPSV